MPRTRYGYVYFRGFRDPRTISLIQEAHRQLGRLQTAFPKYNAIISRTQTPHEVLLKHAEHSQARHTSPRGAFDSPRSPNHGMFVALKDNIVSNGMPTTCASKILTDYKTPANATVVENMEMAGMIPVAKTNMDEFGMGSNSQNSAYGPVLNGRQPEKIVSAGGSSGGSALAVGLDMSRVALGTDTGGSVRLPAAYTHLIGFKPSYGRVSRHGVVPYANSLDTVGIIAKSCEDIFLTLPILDHPDPRDPTCLTAKSRKRIMKTKSERLRSITRQKLHFIPTNNAAYTWQELRHFKLYRKRIHEMFYGHNEVHRRIGVPMEYNIEELHPLVKRSWVRLLSMLRSHGHEIVPVSLPTTKAALSAYYVIAPAEASSNLAKYDGVRYGQVHDGAVGDAEHVLYSQYRGENFGEEVKRRILLGSFTLSATSMDNYFIQAQKVRRKVQDDFNQVFRLNHPLRDGGQVNTEGVDFLICPTAPTPPPSLSEMQNASPLESYMNDVFTVPASLAGLPAISLPAPPEPSIPQVPQAAVGMQVIGQYGDDYSVIQFARHCIEGYLDSSRWRHTVEYGHKDKW